MYILICANNTYYTGSTKDLNERLAQHQAGMGSNYTVKNLPVELVYFEEYQRIDVAFHREQQVKKWTQKKKRALINGRQDLLPKLSECMNCSHWKNLEGEEG